MDYGFEHEGKVYTPNGTAVDVAGNLERNVAIEQAELAHWRMRPDVMVAYYQLVSEMEHPKVYRADFRTHGRVSTWLGSELGIVTEAHVYRHNSGHRFVSLRVRGSNGAEYYGRASYDNGSVVRLRRVKGSR